MTQQLRSQVLKVYKQLIKTSHIVFNNDPPRIARVVEGIRENFTHYKNETDEKAIKEMIRAAKDMDNYLKRNVLQSYEVADNTYSVIVKPFMLRDNTRSIRPCEDDDEDHEHEEKEKSPCESVTNYVVLKEKT